MRKDLILATTLLCVGACGILRAEKVKTHSHHKISKGKPGGVSPQATSGKIFSASDQVQMSTQLAGKVKKPAHPTKKPNGSTKNAANLELEKENLQQVIDNDGINQDGTNSSLKKSYQKSSDSTDGYLRQ